MKCASLIFALVLTPALAHAQATIDRPRVGGYLALGLAGDGDLDAGGISLSSSLDPTVGGGLRLELPVHEYVVVGGNTELLTFEQDVAGSEREAVFVFDAWVRVRYAIEVGQDLWVEPYVGVPFGLAIGVLDDPDGSGDEAWPGWNIGALGGANLIVASSVAIFLEVGWRYHQLFTKTSGILGDVDFDLRTHQLALQLGFTILL